ncbi:hypothetical protein [Mariniblastus fucicola]|uniref:Uncharacterized protein n=1 Tax=Mariniblastus fucicola TaxID=980251 RepID=A0A5B9PE75_9BACT|nr:hypothetical protein [Mariniblastus fucicola]QEG23799.1 hypothetical protein MFFC18_37030 [Mariniblastus fucicola]
MHGVWFLSLAPVAAVIAWRFSNGGIRKSALWVLCLSAVALSIWFGYEAYRGTEFTSTAYDRSMHAMGVIFSSINLPILQVMVAAWILFAWPRRWQYAAQKQRKISGTAAPHEA